MCGAHPLMNRKSLSPLGPIGFVLLYQMAGHINNAVRLHGRLSALANKNIRLPVKFEYQINNKCFLV